VEKRRNRTGVLSEDFDYEYDEGDEDDEDENELVVRLTAPMRN
jgi:hypothetical protein